MQSRPRPSSRLARWAPAIFTAFALLLLPLATHSAETTSSNSDALAAYWKFDEGSGTTALDSSGNGNHGTLVNGPTYSADVPSLAFENPYSLQFGQPKSVSAPLVTTATDNVTLTAWVKWRGGSISSQFIVYNGYAGSGYGLILYQHADNRLALTVGGVATFSTAFSLTVDKWQHVALVRDSGTWRIYLDGDIAGTTSGISPFTPTTGTIIGNHATEPEQAFNGSIDDVRFYTRPLTDSEIAHLAAGNSDDFPTPTSTPTETPTPVPNPVPVITGIEPSSVIRGSWAFLLTVNGTGFTENSVVEWNGSNRATAWLSDTQLLAIILPADVAEAGEALVTVLNLSPGGGLSNEMGFGILDSTATPTATPTRTLKPTRTITPTRTPAPSRTVTPTRTSSKTRTSTPTRMPSRTRTSTRTRTPTKTLTPTHTHPVLQTDTPTVTSSPEPTNTPEPPTKTPKPPTNTPIPPTATDEPKPPTATNESEP